MNTQVTGEIRPKTAQIEPNKTIVDLNIAFFDLVFAYNKIDIDPTPTDESLAELKTKCEELAYIAQVMGKISSKTVQTEQGQDIQSIKTAFIEFISMIDSMTDRAMIALKPVTSQAIDSEAAARELEYIKATIRGYVHQATKGNGLEAAQ